jgi:hypothetical protein
MNEADRILFDLRNELVQAVEVDGRAALQDQLRLVQWLISKRGRGDCPHIHAEDWPEIRALLGKSGTLIGWPSKRYCSWAGDDHE